MRLRSVDRLPPFTSWTMTRWPATAKTWAMPWPIKPAPMMAMCPLFFMVHPAV
jgi:hypothetical protein